MRILIETDEGRTFEARKIEGVPPGTDTLILLGTMAIRKPDLESIEADLSRKTGKRCVILPPYIEKVIGIQQGLRTE